MRHGKVRLADTSVVAFATNFDEITDTALARRIDLRLTMPPPTEQQLQLLVLRMEHKWPKLQEVCGTWREDAMAATSFALCSAIVMRALKRHVIQTTVTLTA